MHLDVQTIRRSTFGACSYLHGPKVNRRLEMFLYTTSEIDTKLLEVKTVEGKQYVVYTNSG